jgi:membrane protease YdiL (CAAX protease family)
VFDDAPPVDAIPAPRPILPIDRLEAAFEVLLCSGITMLLLGLALYVFGIPTVTPEGTLVPRAVVLVSLLDTAVVIGLVILFLRAHDESPRQVLIGNRVLRDVGLGIVLIPVVFFLVVLILGIIIYFLPFLRNVPKNPLEAMMRTRGDAILFAFVAMIAGGVREEVQRGFIIHRFDGFLGGGAVGVIVYSTVFGLLHYSQGWDAAIATGCLGATWGFVYLRRRSIIAPVVSHAGFNLAQVAKALALR